MKYYPASCLTILSPLGKAPEIGSINSVLNVTNQLHKSFSMILSKWTLEQSMAMKEKLVSEDLN